MNTLTGFGIEIAATLLMAFLTVAYIRHSLYAILVDLCGTEDRARFWMVFSIILLVGMPMVTALSYRPLPATAPELYVGDIANGLSRSLMSMLITVIGLGLVITLFAAAASRTAKPKQGQS